MSKIICEVCGTSYPETSAQCPICGSVHPGDVTSVTGSAEELEVSGEYTYVKGGRFSKSNVRKRNKGVQMATASAPKKKAPQSPEPAHAEEKPERQASSGNKGLIITIIVLILAIIAVLGYIVVKFLLPALPGNTEPPLVDDPNLNVEEAHVSCTDILLDAAEIHFDEAGQTVELHVSILPAETTDSISFASADPAVATVSDNGVVTAVGRGETVIVVTCGNVKEECAVICDIIPPEALAFRLNRQQITFDTAGSGWLVYSGDIPVEDIIWTSDDESVATIEEGRITAVGEGYTRVHGEYLGNKQSCEVVCAFEDGENEGHEGNGNVTEDGSQNGDASGSQDESTDSSGEYHLDNLYSNYDTEVTVSVGEWFPLRLVDNNGNTVDATWSVQNSAICKVNGGDVTALASGETYIIATYNGQEYRCLVRVN